MYPVAKLFHWQQRAMLHGFNLAHVYLVEGQLRMQIRKPIWILCNCSFLVDAKFSDFLDSPSKIQTPQKNNSLFLEENFRPPRMSNPIASDVKTRPSLSWCKDFKLGIMAVQTRVVKIELRKYTEGSLSCWVTNS